MDFDSLSEEEIYDLLQQYQLIEQYERYNKLEYFKPYKYQKKFAKASAMFKRRLLRAANQIGKSYGASFEVAMHLTGKYQDWYEGERFESSGNLIWALGIDLDSTARVLQKALLGTEDIRNEVDLGTGSIPRSDIIMDNAIKDGAHVRSIKIRHVDGGYNTLQFFASAQGQNKLMGSVVKFIWLDEESPQNFLEIYSQCSTRTTNTNGHVMITCTPEQGMSAFQQMFAEDTSQTLYMETATWWDCPHLSEEQINQLLASCPEYQREMRSKGIPVIGTGAIFPFKDEDVMCEDFIPHDYWHVIAGLDFSGVVDDSVVAYTAYDPSSDCYYLYHIDVFDEIEDKNPETMAKSILGGPTPHIPAVSPHDGGVNSINPSSKAKIMKGLGVNILSKQFHNGTALSLQTKDANNNDREPGLEFMRQLVREGRFKVCRSCHQFFKEKAGLFYAPKNGGGIKTVGKDDVIDATRYSLISLVNNNGIPYGQCKGGDVDTWNNGFSNSGESITQYDPYDLD